MRMRIALLLFAATLWTAAFSAPAPTEAEPVENIIVTGQRPDAVRQLMLDFIVEIGDPVSSNRGYARWRNKLCVGVHNLTDLVAAQYLADKISLAAAELGLEPGAPGCRPNLHIVFTVDGRDMAARLVEASPGAFRPFGKASGTTQGVLALEQFKSSDAPVRWWQITMVVDELGRPAIDLFGLGDIPMVRGANSLIKNSVSDDLWGSLVVVDGSKLGNVTWAQLADYLAMVSLAQVNPDALPSGYDSILNLFAANKAPAGMTEMDRTYLRALYAIDTMMMPRFQRGILASRMVREQHASAADE